MQLSLVAAFIPIVNIFWCGASAQDCNYMSSLLNFGYSKECIDSSVISCSNDEAPLYKECCLAQGNNTNTLTEVNNLLQKEKVKQDNITNTLTEVKRVQENITNTLTEVNNLLQVMKSAEENSSSVVKSLFQEIKSEGENASSVVNFLLQEMKSEEENSSSVVKSLLQEIKSAEENSSSVVKSLLQEIKYEEENSSSVVKSLLQEMKSAEENSSSVVKSLLQEIKSEGENSSSVVKSLLQEIKSEGENASSVVNSILQEIKSEKENSSSVVKSLLQEMKSAEENSSSVLKSLLQEMQSERENEKKSFEILMVNIENITNRISSLEVSHQSDRENISKFLAAIMASLEKIIPKKNCAELRMLGDEFSGGVQTVYPYFPNQKPAVVYCDQVTDGGGWTVIQSRSPLPIRENFTRNWDEYVQGFGDLKGEFWLGLDHIHALTSSAQMMLRVDLENNEGEKAWAQYGTFHVGDAASKYVLTIGNYSGDAGDGMTSPDSKAANLNTMMFSTFDNDNDLWGGNCAKDSKGGWWFNDCYGSYLNGVPINIYWSPFRSGSYYMKKASMKIRPISFGV